MGRGRYGRASAWTQSFGYAPAQRLTNLVTAAGTFGYPYEAGSGGAAGGDGSCRENLLDWTGALGQSPPRTDCKISLAVLTKAESHCSAAVWRSFPNLNLSPCLASKEASSCFFLRQPARISPLLTFYYYAESQYETSCQEQGRQGGRR